MNRTTRVVASFFGIYADFSAQAMAPLKPSWETLRQAD